MRLFKVLGRAALHFGNPSGHQKLQFRLGYIPSESVSQPSYPL